MSRIGKQLINLSAGVELTTTEKEYVFKGAKGTLTVPQFTGLELVQKEGSLEVICKDKQYSNYYGLLRTLVANAVQGVSTGWTKELEINGVGMRAVMNGSGITLSLGFSHPVPVNPPEGVNFNVTKNVVTISGIDKQLVGETAAKIRKLKPPEPYKGKGIRYVGENVRRKAGKTGKTK